MGLVVYFINAECGWNLALVAALKQAAYTLIFGGLIIKFSENLSLKFQSSARAFIIATIIPSLITIVAVYFVHLLKGTPKPLDSTIPTVILSFPGFFFVSYRKRTQMIKEQLEEKIVN